MNKKIINNETLWGRKANTEHGGISGKCRKCTKELTGDNVIFCHDCLHEKTTDSSGMILNASKHNWINGKCTLCKVSKFISNGLDNEEKHKNAGMAEGPMTTFYMLNDGNNTITDILPECEGDVPEKPIGNFELKSFPMVQEY